MRQIKNTGMSLISYGTVSGGVLTTAPIFDFTQTTSLQYTLPTGIPAAAINGSVAVISSP
jgi:hypothetical protein